MGKHQEPVLNMSVHCKSILFCFGWMLAVIPTHAQRSDFSSVDFSRADSIASRYAGYPLNDAGALVIKLTQPLGTDVEKLRVIYKWICNNITYDYSLFLENKRKRTRLSAAEFAQWNKAFNRRLFRELVKNKRTVCTGYAYLLKELCFYAGLTCVIIDGFGRTSSSLPNHSWNAVRLGCKWYYCDATWASGVIDMRNLKFERDYNDAYFLADPVEFFRTHKPLDSNLAALKN